jgi:hypothetical protein
MSGHGSSPFFPRNPSLPSMDALREAVVAAKMHNMLHERSVDVNLWKKHLALVPDEVLERLDIETLVLADNNLAAIPPRIGNLKRLRMLDLGHML